MTADPWEPFAVGKPSTKKNWTNNDCSPFDHVTHVTHARFALDVLRDAVMRPRLVFDESKLNDRRILVNWLSPNHWNTGYRYGTVRFSFKFAGVLKDIQTYWVEVGDYQIKAPRILLTGKTYSASSGLLPYDPSKGNGPWWFDAASNTHYFNNDYCLELLIERELALADCDELDFVNHHADFCSLNRTSPKSCLELGRRSTDAGRLFCASAAALRVGGPAPKSSSLARLMKPNIITWHWEALRDDLRLPAGGARGTCTAASTAASVVARATLLAIAQADATEVAEAMRLFRSDKDAIESCASLLESSFGLAAGSLPR